MGTQETDFATSSAMKNLFVKAEISRLAGPKSERSPNRKIRNTRLSSSGMFSSLVMGHFLLLAAVLPVPCARADIPEPDTVFYGKIINRTSGQEYLLTQ